MDALERLEIERACERLVTAYCHYVDHGQAARIAELFSEDGVWESPEVTMRGREELRRGFGRRQANTRRVSRHVCSNFLLDVVESDRAEGAVYLTLYRHDGKEGARVAPLDKPEMVGEYRDRFVRTPEGWRIAHREVVVSFVRARES